LFKLGEGCDIELDIEIFNYKELSLFKVEVLVQWDSKLRLRLVPNDNIDSIEPIIGSNYIHSGSNNVYSEV
jgi:hypothetical protein